MIDVSTVVVGQYAEMQETVTPEAVAAFAQLSHDNNPLHMDAAYAARTRFGRRIVHGALVSSYISALMATELPGPGSIYLVQHTEFLRPVFLNETVIVRVTVREVKPNGRVTLDQVLRVGDRPVVTGYAIVLIDKVANE